MQNPNTDLSTAAASSTSATFSREDRAQFSEVHNSPRVEAVSNELPLVYQVGLQGSGHSSFKDGVKKIKAPTYLTQQESMRSIEKAFRSYT
jgi:hypothetical protein